MRKGVLVFAVVAFCLTGGTVYFVNNWMKQERVKMAERGKKQEDSGAAVLVATKNLPAGHIITVSDLRWQPWPEKSMPPQFVVRRGNIATDVPAQYVGTVVRRGIVSGSPVTSDGIIKLGDRGFLAAVLRPGMRAISVRVDESTGVSGLVYPGDRVDVILTHEVSIKATEGTRERERKVRVSETILTNVRVIATDQSMDDIKTTKGDVTKPRIPKTATLEVSTSQAEVVVVSIKMGTLHFAVRSLACGGTEAQAASVGDTPNCAEARALTDDAERGKSFTAESDVSRMSSRPDANTIQVYILRGNEKQKAGDGTVTVKPPAEPAEPSLPSQ